jgi:tetratricopeptide (TPR) repeat protein
VEADPFALVLAGQYQAAVDAYVASLSAKPSDKISLYNLGLAYLNLRQYEKAAHIYEEYIRLDTRGPVYSDCGFLGLGTCHWCMGEPRRAVERWKGGLGASFTSTSHGYGGVQVPAILWYAAARSGDEGLKKEAWRRLKKCARWKLSGWTDAVIPYFLRRIDTDEYLSRMPIDSHLKVHERHRCQAMFYVGVRHLSDGDWDGFKAHMRYCAGSWNGYLVDEYYLAIWEVDNGFPPIEVRPT